MADAVRIDRMTDAPRRAIAWFRRDLRLTDNRMLEAATRSSERVWPVFVADTALLETHSTARGRTAWFAANLRALDVRLRDEGSGLTVLNGRPEDVLPAFAAEVGAEVAYAGADEDPAATARDDRVADAFDLHLVDDQRIVPPSELRTNSGTPYTVYTPFRRALDTLVDGAADASTARADADHSKLAPPPPRTSGIDAFGGESSPPHELPPAGE